MVLIAADLGLSYIVDNHVPDFFAAGFFGQKILSECCCRDFRDVFVLGDSEGNNQFQLGGLGLPESGDLAARAFNRAIGWSSNRVC